MVKFPYAFFQLQKLLWARIRELEQQNEKKDVTIKKLRREKHSLQVQVLNQKRKRRYAQLLASNPTKTMKDSIVREVLAPFLSSAQISCFLKQEWTRVRTWDSSDIQLAMRLKLMHLRTYRFLRQAKLIPLPGLETLRRYFQHFKIDEEGFLESVAQLVKHKVQGMTPMQRISCLSMDEIYLRQDLD